MPSSSSSLVRRLCGGGGWDSGGGGGGNAGKTVNVCESFHVHCVSCFHIHYLPSACANLNVKYISRTAQVPPSGPKSCRKVASRGFRKAFYYVRPLELKKCLKTTPQSSSSCRGTSLWNICGICIASHNSRPILFCMSVVLPKTSAPLTNPMRSWLYLNLEVGSSSSPPSSLGFINVW